MIYDAFNLPENNDLPFIFKKIFIPENGYQNDIDNHNFIKSLADYKKPLKTSDYFIYPQKVSDLKCLNWYDVTEEIGEIRRKHSLEWDSVGQIIHRTFDALSKAQIKLDNIEEFVESIVKYETLLLEKQNLVKDFVLREIEKIKKSPYFLNIIAPRENSFSELPFVLEIEGKIYSGRIDRIIIKNNTAYIYDYKTYPVEEKELKKLKKAYKEQLTIYRLATEKIFKVPSKAYILFTYILTLIDMNEEYPFLFSTC